MKKFLILFTCLTLLQGRVMATGDEHVEPIPLGVTVIDLITPPIGKGKAPMCIPRILDEYGIRDWVESLPTKSIAMATLANSYRIIGL